MRITRLRLSGFKSFVEPTDLLIAPGLTGVVGPNGCGKSNLLEAIRWVMGESSPKSMRGGGMEDVIFAGTEGRPARDFAEVSLMCEGDGSLLPPSISAGDDSQFEVTRRIERGAGSAYRANGHDVRAKDVALIFADAATGAHSPALVSQGKVASIIAAKPQERRLLLEEAAGISGLHVRRKDAEQKLRATEANLARVADMLGDMATRAGALRRQARAAERYAKVTDAIRIAEARMIYARWREAARAADAARAEATSAEAAVYAANAAQAAAATAQGAAAVRLSRAREAANAAREAEHLSSAELARQRSEAESLRQRLLDLEGEASRLHRDREAEDALAREGAAAIARLEAAAKEAAVRRNSLSGTRGALDNGLARAADVARDGDVALAEARAAMAHASAERRIADAALAEAERRHQRVSADGARIASEIAALGDGDQLAQAAQAAGDAAEGAAAALIAAEEALAEAALQRETAREEAERAAAALSEARAASAALEREAAALQRSLSAVGGAAVLDAIRVDAGLEAALAAALTDDLAAPVVDADGAYGWTGAAAMGDDPPLAATLTPLANFVDAPAQLARRLAQIGLADADTGQNLAVGQRLVTRDGHMRRWDGFVTSGAGAGTAERLERANRLQALTAQIPEVAAGVAHLLSGDGAARHALEGAEARQNAARAALRDAENAARDSRRTADAAAAALERYGASAVHIAERQAAQQGDAAEAQRLLGEARANLDALGDGAALRDLLNQCEAAANDARDALGAAQAAIATHERALAAAAGAEAEALAEARGWKARAGEAARRINSMAVRAAEVAAQLDTLADKPQAYGDAIAAAEIARSEAHQAVIAAQAEESAALQALQEADGALAAAREAFSSAREERAGAVARADNAEGRRIEMGRISGERFACPPPLLPTQAGFAEEDVTHPQAESAEHERLMGERERIGPVNLIAAEELATLETEMAGATAESEELAQAVNRLRGSIGHLNREGRARLTDAFTKVDGHFQRLFTSLFGGGSAHLALVESDDPLEAGLEIMAQPPGKKLATLTLLSGGEQALTAIALIFALFLTNPAPICVLDEVDAPLDDANVERFCDLLHTMVGETATRYLIVTHNAVTMARMHRLFGVTMVERGVSRLVSVDLNAAEQLLAAE
ncbi:MAG: AAA family ATPase [Sphingomonadaceae bacterium]|nr:AAA family ATPase [Sphingomonadaceae bacterium]